MEVVLPPDEDFALGTPCDVEEHNLNTEPNEEIEIPSLEDPLTSS